MTKKTCFVLFNSSSGTAQAIGLTADMLRQRLADRGYSGEIVSPGEDGTFDALLRRARASTASILVAAGGDGTITALSQVAMETDKTLAILPLGTANLLARDLGIPLEVDTWLDRLDDMEIRHIDVGSVNDRPFLHKVVIGLMPGIASAREHLRSHQNPLAALAFLGFVKRRIDRFRRFSAHLKLDDLQPVKVHASAIAVANNAYSEAFGRIFSRDQLNRGTFSIYVAHRITLLNTFRLFGGMIVGKWRNAGELSTFEAKSVEIDRRKKLVKAMIDGDPATLSNPLRFEMRPAALRVLAPTPQPDSTARDLVRLLEAS